jgi:spore maturation protein CgeB
MRLAKITSYYSDYLTDFYGRMRGIDAKSFADQVAALHHDAFAWFDVWGEALKPLGYEVLEVTANAAPTQLRWAREQGLPSTDLRRIATEQVRRFKPDVLWFDDSDVTLLRQLKDAVPSIKLVLGWSGSQLSVVDHFKEMDLVLSCAPEAVSRLAAKGLRSEHLDHAFDPRILQRLSNHTRSQNLIFLGQIIRGSEFHSRREQLLVALAEQGLVKVHTPTRHRPVLDAGVRVSRFLLQQAVRQGLPERPLRKLHIADRLLDNDTLTLTVDKRLRGVLKPGAFGLTAYQLIQDSAVALNVHANSSPQYASNMRLFEITGVGTCMLTDWKDNLPHFFKPDDEVVTYRSTEECVEKARWLREHPKECAAIGLASQNRTLAEHSYSNRAIRLDEIIRRELGLVK